MADPVVPPGGVRVSEPAVGDGLVRTSADDPTFMEGMTIETRDFDDAKHPYQVVTERLTVIEGREYVRCPTHGLIPLDHYCAKSPHDHWCRTAAHPAYDPSTGEDGLDDQGTSHEDWSNVQSDKLHYIVGMHTNGTNEDGTTTGFCVECEWAWPCRTFHMAAGWGERHDCEDEGWCKHASVPLPPSDSVEDFE